MANSSVSQFTTVFRASDPQKIRRNRQSLSCTSCQKRKARCDRKQPCNSCERRGDAANCRFTSQPAGPSAAPAPQGVSGNRHHEIQNRLEKLEEMVRGLAKQPATPVSHDGNTHSASNGHGHGHGSSRLHQSTADGEPVGEYAGPTSWAALVDSIRDIQNVLEADDRTLSREELEEPEPEPLPALDSDGIFGSTTPVTTDEILRALGPRPEVDGLVASFFSANFVAVPAIHSNQFMRQYDAFWDAPRKADLLWVSILFSVLGCGGLVTQAAAAPLSWDGAVQDKLSTFSSMAVRCLVSGKYMSARKNSVEAVLMLAKFGNIRKKDGDASIWTLYAVAIRLAQRQGYHRDPTKLSLKLTPFEAEMRRRTWFCIDSYDLIFSYQHGMPPMTHDETCDTGHPTNIPDDDFDEDSTVLIPRPETEPWPILACVTKSRCLSLFRRILYRSLSVLDPMTPESVSVLGDDIVAWRKSIPPCLRYRSIREAALDEDSHVLMHRIMLESIYHMCIFLLYRQFLMGGCKNSMFKTAVEFCHESCLRMLDIQFEVHREAQPGGRLYEHMYMVSSYTLHGFLIAAMIVCVELTSRDDLTPEDRQLLINRLKAALHIWQGRRDASRDARHACKIIRSVLRKFDDSPSPSSFSGNTQAPPQPNSSTTFSDTPSTPFPQLPYRGDIAPQTYLPEDYMSHFPDNFDDFMTLDNIPQESGPLDWDAIDRYLRTGTDAAQNGMMLFE